MQEYTEREKEMRINEFEVGAILEDARLMFSTIQDDTARLHRNVEVIAQRLDEALDKLLDGAGSIGV